MFSNCETYLAIENMDDPAAESVDDDNSLTLLICKGKNELFDTNVFNLAFCVGQESWENRYTREVSKLSGDSKHALNAKHKKNCQDGWPEALHVGLHGRKELLHLRRSHGSRVRVGEGIRSAT